MNFDTMTPTAKKTHLSEIFNKAMALYRTPGPRSGTTQGFAFLWLSLYGKDSMNKAFRAFIKKQPGMRIINDYRGSKYAWYFGSHNDVGVYDALGEVSKFLKGSGIECYACDEWD